MRALDRVLAPLSWLAAALVAVLLFAGPNLIGAEKEEPSAAAPPAATATATAEATAEATADAEATAEATEAAPEPTEAGPSGEKVFVDAGCGGCHTLAAAGATGAIGPNLDDSKPDAARVQSIVASGSGSMPAFAGRLSEADIAAVAQYVAESAGG